MAVPPYIGIDFGTSKSTIAWFNPKTAQAEIIRNAEGEEKTLSLVYFGERETLVGEHAEQMLEYEDEAGRVVPSIKRGLINAFPISLPGGRRITAVEVAAEILRKLKTDVEKGHFGMPVTRAVVTCPASFSAAAREKIEAAAKLAGFNDVALLEEPVAAALAYAHSGLPMGKHLLVYDLGAGTFDVAVLMRQEMSHNGLDPSFRPAMKPMGIERLGGDDFDLALYDYLYELASQQVGRSVSAPGTIDLKLLKLCRDRKINLSAQERARFSTLLPTTAGPLQVMTVMERATFEALIEDRISQTVRLTRRMVDDAARKNLVVDTLVMVGGSSRIPFVERLLKSALPVEPKPWAQRDMAVALGAAYEAHRLWGKDNVREEAKKTYRAALEEAKQAKMVAARAISLIKLVQSLGLSAAEALDLEREVLGKSLDEARREQLAAEDRQAAEETHRKEELARREIRTRYTKAVRASAKKPLTRETVEELNSLVHRLGLSAQEAGQIETQLLKTSKEQALTRLLEAERTQYRQALTKAWADKRISQDEFEELTRLATSFSLTQEEVIRLERQVLGNAKESLFQSQPNMVERPVKSMVITPATANLLASIGTLQGHTGAVYSIAYSHDGQTLASGSGDGTVKLWRTSDNTLLRTLEVAANSLYKRVYSVVFSPDGQTLASGSWRTIKLWQAWDGTVLRTIQWQPKVAWSLVYSPDGQILASGWDNGKVKLWQASDCELLRTLDLTQSVFSLAFSPDGQTLASGSSNETVKVWNVSDGALIHTLQGHTDWVTWLRNFITSVTSVAYSPDGQTLASGSTDNTVKVWNVSNGNGTLLITLKGHSGSVTSVAYSPDGQTLASGSQDKTVRLWGLEK